MEPRFTSDWFSGHIPLWERVLGPLKGKADLSFLEVGSYEGRSACWLLQNILTHESARLTCVDLFEVGEELLMTSDAMGLNIRPAYDIGAAFDANIRAIGATDKVLALKGKSRELLRTLPLDHFDCAYIDGSHTSVSALSDGLLAWDLLKPGGLLIFDDYQWNCFPDAPLRNPATGIDAFLTCFVDEYETVHKEFQVIVRKTEKTLLAA